MTRFHAGLRALPLAVLLLSSPPSQAQEVVYLVRHAEQAREGQDHGLTEVGRRRAKGLGRLLEQVGITGIYASETRRAGETAEPLARTLGLEIHRWPGGDVEGLIGELRREHPRGRVLVVGHSNTVPSILRGLGATGDLVIEDEDYDNLIVLVSTGSGPPVVFRQRFPLPTCPSHPRALPSRPDAADGQPVPADIFAAALAEDSPRTPNISTEELIHLLAVGEFALLDTRPHAEWAVSHIPGALNVAPKPGMPMSLYTSDVAEVERLVGGDHGRPLVLYCNGPFCGKSKRVAEDLLAAGFTDVRRYQLGAPVWRALGGVMAIEPDGARYVYEADRTAVWIDARDPEEFRSGSLAGAKNLPRSLVLPGKDVGEVRAAKDDGRLPMEDHNTRIIVFGRDGEEARAVAEAIAREAFHNVTYFEGDFATLRAALR